MNKYLEKIATEVSLLKEGIPIKMLLDADRDPRVKGYIYPHDNITRMSITNKGVLVGFLTPRKSGNSWRTGAIYVDPKYRNQGIGSKAITKFFSGNRSGVALVEHDNAISKRSFEKAGFKVGNKKCIDGTNYFIMIKKHE